MICNAKNDLQFLPVEKAKKLYMFVLRFFQY